MGEYYRNSSIWCGFILLSFAWTLQGCRIWQNGKKGSGLIKKETVELDLLSSGRKVRLRWHTLLPSRSTAFVKQLNVKDYAQGEQPNPGDTQKNQEFRQFFLTTVELPNPEDDWIIAIEANALSKGQWISDRIEIGSEFLKLSAGEVKTLSLDLNTKAGELGYQKNLAEVPLKQPKDSIFCSGSLQASIEKSMQTTDSQNADLSKYGNSHSQSASVRKLVASSFGGSSLNITPEDLLSRKQIEALDVTSQDGATIASLDPFDRTTIFIETSVDFTNLKIEWVISNSLDTYIPFVQIVSQDYSKSQYCVPQSQSQSFNFSSLSGIAADLIKVNKIHVFFGVISRFLSKKLADETSGFVRWSIFDSRTMNFTRT